MQRSKLRFLLLQARNQGDRVLDEERAQFASRMRVEMEQVVPRDLLSQPLSLAMLQGYDALLVGGSGEYSVLDEHPGIEAGKELLAEVAQVGFPTFASCFGFQLMVEGMGGQVILDADNAEVGTFKLELTPEGASDPIFGTLPPRFDAQLGHRDRAYTMPAGVHTLASSPCCPHQALRVSTKPVYAAQFHPELTWLDNRGRFERYMDYYGRLFGEVEAGRILREDFRASPAASSLLGVFVDVVLGAA